MHSSLLPMMYTPTCPCIFRKHQTYRRKESTKKTIMQQPLQIKCEQKPQQYVGMNQTRRILISQLPNNRKCISRLGFAFHLHLKVSTDSHPQHTIFPLISRRDHNIPGSYTPSPYLPPLPLAPLLPQPPHSDPPHPPIHSTRSPFSPLSQSNSPPIAHQAGFLPGSSRLPRSSSH